MIIAHARFIVCCTQVIGLAALCVFNACDREAGPSAAPSAAAPVPADQLRIGEKAYEAHCAQCHYAGEGGANVPPLANSPVLLGPPAATFKVILQGQANQSVVNGQKFNGIMPAMDYLTDEEIASVTAYLRHRFAAKEEPVTPAQVAEARRNLPVSR